MKQSIWAHLSGRRQLLRVAALGAVAALGLSACDNDGNKPPLVNYEYGSLRIIHASPDAPAVNVTFGNNNLASDLDYGETSNYVRALVSSDTISVHGILPSGTAEVITVNDFNVTTDTRTNILAVNEVATIKPWVVDDSSAMPTDEQVALNVVHASPTAPTVDVYVTAPGADLDMTEPAFAFSYEESVDAGALAAGTVHIRVTPTGTKTVVFDSGPVDLSGFGGQKLLLAAISTVTPSTEAASPIKILVAADSGNLTLYDVDTAAGARVVHASPDAASAAGGAVEVYATSAALGTDPVELIPAFDYLDIVPAADTYVSVPAGDYVFDVAPNTDMIGDSVFTSDAISLMAGMDYTVVAAGRVTSSPAFGLLATVDYPRAIATQASIKVIHAAPAAGNVDVFVTAAGAYTADEVANGSAGDPLLSEFAFGVITDYVPVTPGDYDIRVVAGGVVAINIEGLTLAAGGVYSAIARGPSEPSGTPEDFGVVLLSN